METHRGIVMSLRPHPQLTLPAVLPCLLLCFSHRWHVLRYHPFKFFPLNFLFGNSFSLRVVRSSIQNTFKHWRSGFFGADTFVSFTMWAVSHGVRILSSFYISAEQTEWRCVRQCAHTHAFLSLLWEEVTDNIDFMSPSIFQCRVGNIFT